MVLIINTSLCMILLYLADIIGRKPVFMIAATNITIGMVVNCFYPNLMVKLAGLGYAGGSEGIFSAIFTMMINEVTRKLLWSKPNLVESTKIRSTLISGCFFSYALGCIFINLVTLVIRDGMQLSIFGLVLVFIFLVPSYFCYAESPKWLYNKGKLSSLIDSLVFIAHKNGTDFNKDQFYNMIADDQQEYKLIKENEIRISIKKKKGKEKSKHALYEILTTKRY